MKYVWHIRVKTPNHGEYTATVEAPDETAAHAAASLQVRMKYPETRDDTFSSETVSPRPVVRGKIPSLDSRVILEAYQQFHAVLLGQIKELLLAGKSFTVTRVHDEWQVTVQE